MKKTIFITGSTDGIGKLAAMKMAKAGHEVYLHGRNAEKLENTITELKSQNGNENIGGFVADLSDLKAVKRLAEEVSTKLPKLDVLINNAGVYKSAKATNDKGLDLRFVVNYLAPFQLTYDLLPLTEGSKAPAIINLSSAAQATVDLDLLQGSKTGTDQATYAQSKLALTMWSYAMAKEHDKIRVVPVNPGSLLNTNMVKEAFGMHWSSADKGAIILYDLAVTDRYAGISGKYFDNDHGAFGRPHADVFDEEKVSTLLKTTEKLIQGL